MYHKYGIIRSYTIEGNYFSAPYAYKYKFGKNGTKFEKGYKFEDVNLKSTNKPTVFTEKEMKLMGQKLMKSVFDCFYPFIEQENLER